MHDRILMEDFAKVQRLTRFKLENIIEEMSFHYFARRQNMVVQKLFNESSIVAIK
jgi:hypothetical protein